MSTKLDPADIIEEHFGTRDLHEAQKLCRAEMANLPDVKLSSTLYLPYRNDYQLLRYGEPIPTVDEIDACRDTEYDLTRGRIGGSKVYKIRGFAVKMSGPSLVQEAENLIFLTKNSRIRVPTVYAMFASRKSPNELSDTPLRYYLVMEFIDGQAVTQQVWNALSATNRMKIGNEFTRMLESLGSISLTNFVGELIYYGRINQQGFPPSFKLLRSHLNQERGPFYTYKELVDAIYETAKLNAVIGDLSDEEIPDWKMLRLASLKEELSQCDKKQFKLMWDDPKVPRLTYLNPKLENIILRPVKPGWNKPKKEEFEVVFLDWQHLAWLPAWFQSSVLLLQESRQFQEHGYTEGWKIEGDMVEDVPSFLLCESRGFVN